MAVLTGVWPAAKAGYTANLERYAWLSLLLVVIGGAHGSHRVPITQYASWMTPGLLLMGLDSLLLPASDGNQVSLEIQWASSLPEMHFPL